ncbi:MAG: DUF4236 domain-containing protein [Saccharofermentans sp.]|nr:DUF4236 domain-containing protein [Saccharofermentans sp.]
MGLNFRKSISIFPGVRLNLSKSGVSTSFGVKGMRQSISTTGKAVTTLGIPGTGVYYTKQTNVKKLATGLKDKFTGKNKKNAKAETAAAPVKENAKKTNKVDKVEIPVAENEAQVKEYEAYVESIKSVHKVSDGLIDWTALKNGEVPSTIIKGSEEHKEWLALQEFSDKILAGDIDSYLEVVAEVKPFDDLLEFGSNFQVGTDDPTKLEVEFGVMADEVVPKVALSLTAKGEVSEKELSKTAYCDLLQDYVCSTTIRIARDAFALLPVQEVIVHAVDKVLNTATGFEDEMTLLSVKFDRETVMALNLGLVDPSDALTNFQTNMKFKKTEGFAPVDRIS